MRRRTKPPVLKMPSKYAEMTPSDLEYEAGLFGIPDKYSDLFLHITASLMLFASATLAGVGMFPKLLSIGNGASTCVGKWAAKACYSIGYLFVPGHLTVFGIKCIEMGIRDFHTIDYSGSNK